MKRSSRIFFVGLLCFSLGYIAHDIAGEAGVKLAGSAQAFPISPITSHAPYDSTVGPQQQRNMLVSHTNETIDKLCPSLKLIWDSLYIASVHFRTRSLDEPSVTADPNYKQWLVGYRAMIEIQQKLCHMK